MNNQQFCSMLQEMRELSGISRFDIMIKLRKSESTINNMIRGRYDNMMDLICELIDAYESIIALSKNGDTKVLWSYDDIKDLSLKLLSLKPTKETSESLGVALRSVNHIKRNQRIKLSIFLKLLEINGYEITIIPKSVAQMQYGEADV